VQAGHRVDWWPNLRASVAVFQFDSPLSAAG